MSASRSSPCEPTPRPAALHLRRRRAAAHASRPAPSSSSPPRTASAARCAASDDLPSRGLRVPVPQPGHRPDRRRGRRARRHPRGAPRRDRPGPRLGGVGDVPALRGADRHAQHGDAARPARGASSGSTRSTASAGTCLFRPRRGGPRGRAAARPDARHGRRRAGGRRGVLPASRPAAHGGNMDTPEMRAGDDGVLRRQRARRACSPSATGTAGRARARCAAPRSRPR